MLSGATVVACLAMSQCAAHYAKKARLRLNDIYWRKKFKKDQIIQYAARKEILIKQLQRNRSNIAGSTEAGTLKNYRDSLKYHRINLSK